MIQTVDILLTSPDIELVGMGEGCSRYGTLSCSGLDDALKHLTAAMTSLYGRPLGVGTFRSVWVNGAVVYKVPNPRFSPWGGCDNNIYEANEAADEYVEMHVAPCRLVWHESGVPIVIMEAVNPTPSADCAPRPEWSGLVDANQVGLRANGRWAVYDAGCPPNNYHCGFYRNAKVPPVFSEAS